MSVWGISIYEAEPVSHFGSRKANPHSQLGLELRACTQQPSLHQSDAAAVGFGFKASEVKQQRRRRTQSREGCAAGAPTCNVQRLKQRQYLSHAGCLVLRRMIVPSGSGGSIATFVALRCSFVCRQ